MPCPIHNNDDDENRRDDPDDETTFRAERSRIERRELLKSALVIGGTSALSTVTGLYGMPAVAAAEDGHERITVAERENRQHAWDAYETFNESHEMSPPPAHHLLLHVDYTGDGKPASADRREAAEAFREVERQFAWSHDGVLFTVGYSLEYFRRFEEMLPSGIDPDVPPTGKPSLRSARGIIDTAGVTLDREDPEADGYDACIHLASDHVQKLLAVEAALWGEEGAADVSFDATLDGIFTKPESYPERRVGFAGHDSVVKRLDADTDFDASRIPGADEDGDEPKADLSMGLNDQYLNSVPRETNVTMLEDQQLIDPKPPGVFAQGTIQHVSKIDIDLDRFYDDHDEEGRRARMFSPHHDADNTGTVGENLGNSNAPGDHPMRRLDGTGDDVASRTQQDFEEKGVVGHAQKTARARFDLETRITEEGQVRLSGGEELLPADERDDDLPGHDGPQTAEQVILRRDIDTTDQGRPGNHFVALMRFSIYLSYNRQAMNGVAFDSAAFTLTGDDRIQHDAIGAGPDSGIVNYFDTRRRGNYLVPPITLRALPHPRGDELDIAVSRRGDTYVVEVDGLDRDEIDLDTVRFGWYYDVNRGRGADVADVSTGSDAFWNPLDGGTLTMEFPAADTGIDAAPGGPDGDDDVRLRLFGLRSGSGRPVRGTANLRGGDGSRRGRGRHGDNEKDGAHGRNGGRTDEGHRQDGAGRRDGAGRDHGRGTHGHEHDGSDGRGRGRSDDARHSHDG